jgi:hypothetical protein
MSKHFYDYSYESIQPNQAEPGPLSRFEQYYYKTRVRPMPSLNQILYCLQEILTGEVLTSQYAR